MSGLFRTRAGGRIDRAKALRFTFDGRPYQGLEGDTLASALLANGVHLMGRSYKYHRPRGVLGAGAEEPNALVGLDEGAGRLTPNLRATQILLRDGLVARSQNRWPSLAFDLGAINSLFKRFYGAGFYYKTFFGPRFLPQNWTWRHVFEPVVRVAAGLGAAPKAADPDAYASYHLHCDALIVGSGPAGLAAALDAARSGARVILCEEQNEIGGSLLAEPHAIIEGMRADEWLDAARAQLTTMANVRVFTRTQAFGYYAQNFLGLNEIIGEAERAQNPHAPRERLWKVRAKEIVLACGAIERPLVFPDNDRPGVMLAGAARVYLHRYGVKVGSRVVVVTAHDGAYRTALDLHAAGVEIARIVDLRGRAEGPLVEAAQAAGIAVTTGARIAGTRGGLRVSAVGVETGSGVEWISCDALAMSGGCTPSLHLHSQSRAKVVWDAAREMFLPGASVQRERSVGACRGSFTLEAALNEGAQAGADAARAAGFEAQAQAYAVSETAVGEGGFVGEASGAGCDKAMAFVDFQNDVCAKDIRLAVQEGMRSIEHVKRYTTTGMASDQGKTSNLNALALAAQKLGAPIPQVGLTTFRPPYTPLTFGALAGAARGDLFDPVRRAPLHEWAAERGALFEDVGLWKRALAFPQGRESLHMAVERECRAVRAGVGLFDASTLGKIEIVGPGAAAFLERMYINAFAKLGVGRCRYALMLNEQGFIMDDGIVARLAPDRFHVTTTTGGAARVLHHMEDYLQTEFTDLDVWLTSISEQWATIAVQGPKSRELIAPLIEGIDLSPNAMPHMSLREGTICGAPTRLMRVSFTGELGFEINVAPNVARSVWERLWAEGRSLGVVAYGTEAMHVMRAEKGYLIVGQDTDGTVTPHDAGFAGMIGKAKGDFVGKRSLARRDLVARGRKQLVGLEAEDARAPLDVGAQIVATDAPAKGAPALGHVTSAYDSPTLHRPIALAMLTEGRARMGERVFVTTMQGTRAARVCDPVFFDRECARLDA